MAEKGVGMGGPVNTGLTRDSADAGAKEEDRPLQPTVPILTTNALGTHGFVVYLLLVTVAGSSLSILYLLPCFAGYRASD